MNEVKPIDKTKKSNRRCINCAHYPNSGGALDFCETSNRNVHYWNCCSKFEWNPNKTYVEHEHGPTDLMLSSDGTITGEIINFNSRPCAMEGCTGVRIHVRWPDGMSTYPCSKGCTQIGEHLWKIG